MNERNLKHNLKKPILMFTFCPYRVYIYINVHEFAYCTRIYSKTDNTVGKILTSSYSHGLINHKDTKTKCRFYWCLIEFIDRIYSQSCWYYFRPSFVNYLPSNLLSGSAPPLLPPIPKVKVQYIQTVRGWEGMGGGEGGVELCWRLYSAGVLTLCF
jgi:hypothetical protein